MADERDTACTFKHHPPPITGKKGEQVRDTVEKKGWKKLEMVMIIKRLKSNHSKHAWEKKKWMIFVEQQCTEIEKKSLHHYYF